LQVDPVGYDSDLNLYAYVGNDPLNKVDPMGLQEQCVTGDMRCEKPPLSPPPANLVTIEVVVVTAPRLMAVPTAVPRPAAPAIPSPRGAPAGFAIAVLLDMIFNGCGDTGRVGACAQDPSVMTNKEDSSSDDGDGADDKKLTPGEIKKLKEAGYDPEELKGGRRTGQWDLFKDKKGNITVKPKDGSGPGDPAGININDL
jgi:hypothetical protein